MAAGAIGWLVARLVLARVVRRPAIRILLLNVAALAILAVVVLPAYDDVVVKAFPAGVSGEPVAVPTDCPGPPARPCLSRRHPHRHPLIPSAFVPAPFAGSTRKPPGR